MEKKYISQTNSRAPRPRSKRLREQGIGSTNSTIVLSGAAGGSTAAQQGDGHTHANKAALDQISTDGDGYEYITRLKPVTRVDEATGEETTEYERVTEKVKAGYADEAGVARELADSSSLDGKYLSKLNPDTAAGLITFLQGLIADGLITAKEGLVIGNFVAGFVGGMGGMIDKDGNAELKSLRLREFLEVPELRFNRIDVVSGELWNSICFGTIERVDEKKRVAWLKLQDGELSGIEVGDICRGVFHCLEGSNPTESKEDECGFLQLAGFATSYFTPTAVYDNGASFRYSLRQGTSVHPQVGMRFAVYGSFSNPARRASAYMTRTYTRYLNKVDTWQVRPDVHIYGQTGDIEGLTINGTVMHGYGAYLHNLYLSGVHVEFDRDWIDHNLPKTYNVVLSTYERTVVTDIEGNPLNGLEELRNVVSGEGNVVSGEENVIATRLALTTTVQATKNGKPMLFSDVMDEGKFLVELNCVGCTAKCENGVVKVTSLDMESVEHRVSISVNCEGEAVYVQEFNVPVVKQGENGVTADLDNEMASIAANDKGEPIIVPFEEIVSNGRMWYGNEEMYLVRAEVEVPGGITVADVTTVTDEEGQHNYLPIVDNKYCVLRITDVAKEAADINLIRVSLTGKIKAELNTEYSKVVVFKLNKVRMGENAQNYSLMVSTPQMQVDGKGNFTTAGVSCSVIGSDGKTLSELTAAELSNAKLTLKAQLYNGVSDYGTEQEYSYQSTLGNGSVIGGKTLSKDSVRLVFLLYWNGLLIDKEGVPIVKNGSSTVRIDLDNENDSMLYNENGEKVSSNCTTNVSVYDGGSNVTSQCTLAIEEANGVTASLVGTQCIVSSVSSVSGYVKIRAFYPADNNYYYTIFTVKRLVGEDKYEIVTIPSTVVYDPNTKKYSEQYPNVYVYRTDQEGNRSEVSGSLPYGYALQYSYNGSNWYAVSNGFVTANVDYPNIYLRVRDNNYIIRDSETIPVVTGGLNGSFKSIVFKRSNEKPTTPSGGSYDNPKPDGWEDGIPAGSEILWSSSCIFTVGGGTPQWTEPRQMTDTADFDVEFSSLESPSAPTGHPNTNTQWSNNADENTLWMATSTCKNGVWSDWVISKIKGEKGDDGVFYQIVTDMDTIFPDSEYIQVYIRKTEGNSGITNIYLDKVESYGMSLRATLAGVNINGDIEYTSDSQIGLGSSVAIGSMLKIQLVNAKSTGTYTKILAERNIACIGRGEQGLRGPALRGPQYWDKLDSGYQFYSGAAGEPFIDVVFYEGNFYSCTNTHTKTSARYPGSSTSNTYKYWTKGSSFELIATNILLAKYLLVENLGASAIEMKDASGNTVFEAKEGNVKCLTGTFENVDVSGKITSDEGTIGGFSLSSNGLSNDEGNASISFPMTGTKFLHINKTGASGLLDVRNDGGTAAFFQSYGDDATAIFAIGQAGYQTKAIEAYGNTYLTARTGEQVKITGLGVSVHKIASTSDSIKGCDDLVIFDSGSSGTYSMPSASSYPGKVIYVKKLSGSNMTGLTGSFREAGSSSGATSETFCANGVSMMYISDGSYWNVFYCG